MGHQYVAVSWNRQKRVYDLWLAVSVALYLALFIGLGSALRPNLTPETLMIRAFATGAFLLLHVILCIGPLARLNPRFLPLLYNRRHMGVTMFALALAHGALATIQFHVGGIVNPLVSLLAGNSSYGSLDQFPFQPLGFAALVILFAMAATSHDFWLANLTAPVWKALHMLVYVAYGLIVMHVALGALQVETSPVLVLLLGAGLMIVLGLHLVAGLRERGADAPAAENAEGEGWVRACAVDAIPEKRAVTVSLAGERVAVFRYDGKVSAVSAVCQHQNGPLGEGRIIDDCITCPWHGYQYVPDCGASPPPFEERIPTFAVRIQDGDVWIDPKPKPAGTHVEPATIGGAA